MIAGRGEERRREEEEDVLLYVYDTCLGMRGEVRWGGNDGGL